jgi:GNAT superfamily N-acetyltransferase
VRADHARPPASVMRCIYPAAAADPRLLLGPPGPGPLSEGAGMTAIDPEYLQYEYHLSYRGIPHTGHASEDYPMCWTVSVHADVSDLEDDGEELREVGSAVVYLVTDAGLIDLFDTLGAYDAELARFGEVFGMDHPELLDEAGLREDGDLLIVSSLTVAPEFRGRRLGYWILNAIIETIGRHAWLTVLDASPLEGPDGEAAGDTAGQESLKKYWEGFGFHEVENGFMVFGDTMAALAAELAEARRDEPDGYL